MSSFNAVMELKSNMLLQTLILLIEVLWLGEGEMGLNDIGRLVFLWNKTIYQDQGQMRKGGLAGKGKMGQKASRKQTNKMSSKTNTSRHHHQSSVSPPKRTSKCTPLSQPKLSRPLSVNKSTRVDRSIPMASSVNLPHLSPVSHSQFTRNNSLQFSINFGQQSIMLNPLGELFERTKVALKRYQTMNTRLSSRNKEISRKLTVANQHIALLQRQLRRSREL